MTDGQRVVESAAELLEFLTLDEVNFNELRAKRRDVVEGEEIEDPTIRVYVRDTHPTLFVRCVVEAKSPDGEYCVDAIARFSIADEVEISEEVAHEFVERVGVMAVYPFVREAMSNLSTRLGGGHMLLGLFRPGRVEMAPLSTREPDTRTEDQAT